MNRIFVFVIIMATASILTAGCAKKTIDSGPHGSGSYTAAAGGEATGGAVSGSDGEGRPVQEESLEGAGDRSRMLSAGAAAERDDFENQDILFEFDSAILTKDAQQILRGKARWLQANPDVAVIIEGHCDDRGTNEYNLALGEKRARNTRDFLVTLGVDPSRLSLVSYGEERPLVAGTSEQARAKNRRAHFVIEL